ncbi:PREDICTED: protein NRT1/ PTR FAMILY 1.2-like [Ipomoea nil]|uniref:protein NRT1/ PTR FAMILY 1.2-like n=1 Tax=Ipomoea nil TaxID=35883 RepID=UPI00090155BB|nr:PREDICTED: protein NRT1/ PTR FAMILY 1.2-like [Ipomoea nil]XP_019197062.1 PREDICTED: protein NRT1/ PTR FAMILY 1.2-like [Ipomoea nil]
MFALCEVVALTCLVYIQENAGWKIGYGILVVFMLFAALSFFLGSPFYVKQNAKRSLIPGLLKVIVASCTNRHLKFSSGNTQIGYHHNSSTTMDHPSERLRFLNKACIIQDPQQDLNSDGTAIDPWRLCTVDQVEELKAILRVIPIWFTGVIMSVDFCQSSFAVLQATTLDRHIFSSNFEIPAGSVGLFGVGFSFIWIVLYDRLLLPVASRIRGNTVHFGTKSRMGFGIFMSFWYAVMVGKVESIRRSLAIKQEHSSDNLGDSKMSILWIVPQYALKGIAVGSNAVAQNQFFISEFPRSMSTIASSLYALGYSLASLLASLLMSSISELSRSRGNGSWITSDINEGHYDYFYWVLAGLSMVNFLLFLICSRSYGPSKDEKPVAMEED